MGTSKVMWQTQSLADTLDDKLSVAEDERHWDILGDVKAEILVEGEAETLNTHWSMSRPKQ